jgi:POT family proton-dependent oligopeptide transporter
MSGAPPEPAQDPAPGAPERGSGDAVSFGQALRELSQPFRDFSAAPSALRWGVNVPAICEGLIYFGMLTVLTKFLSENVALGDVHAGQMVALFSGGITGMMFLLGGLGDRWGVRRALLFGLVMMIIGRTIIASGETLHMAPGLFGSLHITVAVGMLCIMVGYGTFQPTLYAAVKHYTDEKTSALGFALIYAVTNLGAFASGLLSPRVRHMSEHALPPNGITGVLWVYAAMSILGILAVTFGLRKRQPAAVEDVSAIVARSLAAARLDVAASEQPGLRRRIARWLAEHPLRNKQFTFFIFIVVPVQTLFAHAWLTMPLYIERAYRSTPLFSQNFEFFSGLNPLLIFILTPIVAAVTARINVYRMMIIGTTVMAAPTFLLAFGPSPTLLILNALLTSLGEALWQPRFLQYIAEIAPPGKTAQYMGIGQFPWFLTKVLTGMYSGWFLSRYCPAEGPQNTEFMWLVYGVIALVSPIGLVLAGGWVRRTMKTSAAASAAKAAAGVSSDG